MLNPEINRCYSFDEIKSEYGLHRSYAFRNSRNEITAFVLNKEMNPSIADYLSNTELNILVAKGKYQSEANVKRLLTNREYPVFIKEGTNEWRYIGVYWCAEKITNRLAIAPHLKGVEVQLAEIVCVLRFSRVSNAMKSGLKLAS